MVRKSEPANPEEKVYPRLESPPIAEAIIQLNCAGQRSLGDIDFQNKIRDDFSGFDISPQRNFDVQAVLGDDEPRFRVNAKEKNGLRLTSQDKQYVMLLSNEGLTFSRVGAYPGWDEFRSNALKYWGVYASRFSPIEITRIAVRFINQMQARTADEAKSLLKNLPVPAGLPETEESGFFFQSTHAFRSSEFKAHVVRVLQQNETDPNKPWSIYLDVDIFSEKSMKNDGVSLNHKLEKMRSLKNAIFFGSVSSKAIKLFSKGANQKWRP